MATRLTDTTKWDDSWFRPLTPTQKLAWLYLCDQCDIAGVVDLDEGLANFRIGDADFDWEEFIRVSNGRIVVLESGNLWIRGFIEFQQRTSELNPRNRYHRGIIRQLYRHRIDPVKHGFLSESDPDMPLLENGEKQERPKKGPSKAQERAMEGPTPRPHNNCKSPSPSPIKKKGGDGGGKKPLSIDACLEVLVPDSLYHPDFIEAWQDWLDYKQSSKKPWRDVRGVKAQLTRLKSMGKDCAIAAIYRSISQEWQGIYPDGSTVANEPNSKPKKELDF